MKQTIAISLLTFLAGYLTCQYYSEPQINTEIKEVRVRDVVTVVKEVKREERRPDGTVIVETDTTTDKRSETKKDTTASLITSDKPQWTVGAYSNVNTDHFLLTVDRRVFTNVFVGVYGAYDVKSNDLSGGLGIRVEF